MIQQSLIWQANCAYVSGRAKVVPKYKKPHKKTYLTELY
ncbi:hypothetical protein GNIT_0461 [Glaciecola nitratireducens FR1064]|uniref:Uncharacterized protein n=1 Tax=Glaciecola nitratireducens (strain JCM 12485 / KCTC 12276 / FR1064) TaxID=1085623 RepID=G4QFJ0_GLANF|nr:hypothetical protein GNIT_0461 [Glaciecola nitratireducens FR1064]